MLKYLIHPKTITNGHQVKFFLEIKCQNVRNEVDQVLRQHLFKMGLTKEGKKKNSSFNGLDFDAIFYFFVRLIKKWSKTKLLQIKIDIHLYK